MNLKFLKWLVVFVYWSILVLGFLIYLKSFEEKNINWNNKIINDNIWDIKWTINLKKDTIDKTNENIKDNIWISENNIVDSIIINDIPFAPQAPFWNWWNLMNQEWCEEASIIMAMAWVNDKKLTLEEVDSEIKNISNLEIEMFWEYSNTSVSDTAKLIEEYYDFKNYNFINDFTKYDMIKSLEKWNLLIIPVYGRDLKNIYYTTPGPVSHMLVVVWYDPTKNEFITNDPWTKNGKWYRYDEDILFGSIWTYPTIEYKINPPDPNLIRKKSMIEIFKSN